MTTKPPMPVVPCVCTDWADSDIRDRLLGNGHHTNCPKYQRNVGAIALLAELVTGIDACKRCEQGLTAMLTETFYGADRWPADKRDAYEKAHWIAKGCVADAKMDVATIEFTTPNAPDRDSEPVTTDRHTTEFLILVERATARIGLVYLYAFVPSTTTLEALVQLRAHIDKKIASVQQHIATDNLRREADARRP